MGSGGPSTRTIVEAADVARAKGPKRVGPFAVPKAMSSTASATLATWFKIKGVNYSISSACATSNHCIGNAAEIIQWGKQDMIFAGGCEDLDWTLSVLFDAMGAMSSKFNATPEKASRAYDKDRDGFVIAGGAGVLVLEELEHAKARGAKIYAEVIGYGLSGDAYHVTAPHPEGSGGFRAMQMALRKSGLQPSDIDYINAHGTSTPLGDELELGAVRRLFGNAIANVSMSSTKSAIGHLLGGAGAVESIFCILAMRDQIVPPTLNLDNPSESCEGVDLVPHRAKERPVRAVLNNSFGFGGTNASLVMKAV
jgi:3-oxoacyl-[acyl-carrier-protein] synthase II